MRSCQLCGMRLSDAAERSAFIGGGQSTQSLGGVLKTGSVFNSAMFEQLFKRAFARRRMAANHLAIILEPFACDLHVRGHTHNSIHMYVQAVEHFGRWLGTERIALRRIGDQHIEAFLERHLPRCRCPIPAVRTVHTCRAALARLLDFLRRRRLIPQETAKPSSLAPVAKLVMDYDKHLARVRGLSVSTRRARQRYAEQFLDWRFGTNPLMLRDIRPKDLLRYVNRCATTWTPGGIHDLVVGLRSFLGFLEFSGKIRCPLSRAVPRPAPKPSNPPPKFLDRGQRCAFLKCFDRKTSAGRRNFAIALCLCELGLRAGEVAALSLDDINWKLMTLRLRQTKQQRERLLPLPASVARAVATYLKRGRPPSSTRALFVRHRAPLGEALKSHHVRSPIRLALAHIGIASTGTHILRHTWATEAHRRGTPLKWVADVLGHQSLDTTSRYTHVNLEQLRQAALPWPA